MELITLHNKVLVIVIKYNYELKYSLLCLNKLNCRKIVIMHLFITFLGGGRT